MFVAVNLHVFKLTAIFMTVNKAFIIHKTLSL